MLLVDCTEVELSAVLCVSPAEGTPSRMIPTQLFAEHNQALIEIQRRAIKLQCVPSFTLPADFEIAPCVGLLVFSPGAPNEVNQFWNTLLRDKLKLPT